jgi:hypothetical protein
MVRTPEKPQNGDFTEILTKCLVCLIILMVAPERSRKRNILACGFVKAKGFVTFADMGIKKGLL